MAEAELGKGGKVRGSSTGGVRERKSGIEEKDGEHEDYDMIIELPDMIHENPI